MKAIKLSVALQMVLRAGVAKRRWPLAGRIAHKSQTGQIRSLAPFTILRNISVRL